MAKPRKSLSTLRKLSFSHQNGYCYYCNQPMWKADPKKFSKIYKITSVRNNLFEKTITD